jgi:hypothetical protein
MVCLTSPKCRLSPGPNGRRRDLDQRVGTADARLDAGAGGSGATGEQPKAQEIDPLFGFSSNPSIPDI